MNINWRGPCDCLLGYGACSFNLLRALDSLNHHISYFPIGQIQTTQSGHFLNKLITNAQFFDPSAISFLCWHEFDLAISIGSGARAALSFFELDKLNKHRQHHINSVDHIFVASSWAKKVLENNNIKIPIHICPMGVDSEVFTHNGQDNEGPTQFFNIGKIEVRKGHYELIECFNKAFEPSDNVKLNISWNNPFLKKEEIQEWVNLYKNSKMGGQIEFIPYLKTDQEFAQFINSQDIGVFPTKAEAWGLPILQSLACGKHVVTTNYSGPTEYLNDKNAVLLDVQEMETAYDGRWFFGEGRWAKINEDQLTEALREFHKTKQSGKLGNSNVEGVKTGQRFSWENSAKVLTKELENVV